MHVYTHLIVNIHFYFDWFVTYRKLVVSVSGKCLVNVCGVGRTVARHPYIGGE